MSDYTINESILKRPLLSVVVPVYNVESFLEKTLQSVVDAVGVWLSSEARIHFDRTAVEVICVDDGSTDGSGEIVDKFVSEHSNCEGLVWKVVHQVNAGVSVARNVALDRAHGDWVMMLDGDDTWASDLLVKLFGEIEKHPDCDGVGFGMVVVNEKGECTRSFGRGDVKPAVMRGDEVLLNGRGPYSKFIWSSCDKIYRRSVLEKIPLRYTVGMRHMEDSLFAQVFFAYAGKVVLRPDILGYRYLMRDGSAIHVQQMALPDQPFCIFETLYAHWQKLKTPGLWLRLYYVAAGLPSLGKGAGFAPSVRSKAIEFLVFDETFNRRVMPFMLRYGGVKARVFATVYLLCPCSLRRKLLESL